MLLGVAQAAADVEPAIAVVMPVGHLTHAGLGTEALPPAPQ